MNALVALSSTIDAHQFREALGHYASGVAAISGMDLGEPVGFTCQSFYSVSVDPPLVSFSVAASSTSYPRIRRSGRFGVSVLAVDQQRLSRQLARSGPHKWRGVDWQPSPAGSPLVCGAVMWLDCTITAEYEAGDHSIVVGRVDFLRAAPGASDPLVYHRGRYRGLAAG